MKALATLGVFALSLGVQFAASNAQDTHSWIEITEPSELRSLLSGKTMENEESAYYYRSDGAMAFYVKAENTIVIRKWAITEPGKVCTYIFIMPDKLVTCLAFAKSAEQLNTLKMTVLDRSVTKLLQLYDQPPQLLVDAVNETAGPAN